MSHYLFHWFCSKTIQIKLNKYPIHFFSSWFTFLSLKSFITVLEILNTLATDHRNLAKINFISLFMRELRYRLLRICRYVVHASQMVVDVASYQLMTNQNCRRHSRSTAWSNERHFSFSVRKGKWKHAAERCTGNRFIPAASIDFLHEKVSECKPERINTNVL